MGKTIFLVWMMATIGIPCRGQVCPSGGSEKYLAVDEDSKFFFETHSVGDTLGQAYCAHYYVMSTCTRAEIVCDIQMDGRGKNCVKGGKVSIKYGQKTLKFCKGALRKKTFTVTNDFTILMVSSGPGSVGGSCSIRCLHPCDRPCGGASETCRFSLTAEQQTTNQPGRHADGRFRTVNTFNGRLPGPSLVVCEDDIVEVTLDNKLSHPTSLHFHGIRQVGVMGSEGYRGLGPWSDGVPAVTQCPVAPGSKFKLRFRAGNNPLSRVKDLNAPPGTYWYHSAGAERVEGLQGTLVIKEKVPEYPSLVDMPEKHTIAVQEWYESSACHVPVSILVNGKTRLPSTKFKCQAAEVEKYLEGVGGSFSKVSASVDYSTSYEEFKVQPDKRFRLRIVGMMGQNFPIRFSIDDHTFTAIAADSLYIRPIKNLTNLWIAPGERFDIVLETKRNYPKNAFKMRFLGFTKLTDSSSALCSIAWLRYPGQKIDKNYIAPSDCSDLSLLTPDLYPPAERTLNPPGLSYTDWEERLTGSEVADTERVGSIYPADIRSNQRGQTVPVIETKFIEIGPANTFNGIQTTYPQVPYLLQSKDMSETCDVNNKRDFTCSGDACSCPHLLQFPFSPRDWAQIVIINTRNDSAAYPIYQHGGRFRVVGQGVAPHQISKCQVMEQFLNNKLPMSDSLDTVQKDVVQVPRNGYVIIRLKLDNPGAWLLRSHIDSNLVGGMGLVVQIGEKGDWTYGPLAGKLDVPCPL